MVNDNLRICLNCFKSFQAKYDKQKYCCYLCELEDLKGGNNEDNKNK